MQPSEPATGFNAALELLIVQPTPFCNLACDYCYLTDKDAKQRISESTLRVLFQQVFASRFARPGFTIVWHAGEPMVVGLPFYENALRLVAELDAGRFKPQHSMQTNGTLLTPEWCEFIKKSEMRIGVSVDGPAFLHDKHRVTRSGAPTYDRVMHGVRLLVDHKVDFHVITVVTKDALEHADALFDFYLENGIRSVGINLEESEGANARSSLKTADLRERVKRFFERLLARAVESKVRIFMREFDGLGAFLLRGERSVHNRCQESDPFRIINVDVRGNYSTFSPELVGIDTTQYGGSFALGNVHTDSLDAAPSSPRFAAMNADVEAGVRQCRDSCDYFDVCGGGNAANKYFENGTFASSETMACILSKKALVDALLGRFETLLGLESPLPTGATTAARAMPPSAATK